MWWLTDREVFLKGNTRNTDVSLWVSRIIALCGLLTEICFHRFWSYCLHPVAKQSPWELCPDPEGHLPGLQVIRKKPNSEWSKIVEYLCHESN